MGQDSQRTRKSSPGRPVHVRIAYWLVAAGCAAGFVYGSWQSWVKYKHEPLTSTTEEVALTDLTLPSVTICPYPYYMLMDVDNSDWTLETASYEMDMVPTSILQGNQEVYYNSDEFLATIGRNRSELVSITYMPLQGAAYNSTLACYTINPLSQKEVPQAQEIVTIQFASEQARNQTKYFAEIHIHERNALVPSLGDLLGMTKKSFDLNRQEGRTTFLELKPTSGVLKRYPKKSRSACLQRTNPELDATGCLMDLITTRSGCKLPRTVADMDTPDPGFCKTLAPVNQAVYQMGNWLEADLAANGCVPSCTRTTYYWRDGIHTTYKHGNLSGPELSDKPILEVAISNTQRTRSVTEEELVFSGFDFVASVGGYLGLYLGASIISVYEIGFGILSKVVGRRMGAGSNAE